jgi:phenylalanyl-tRNA synthetase alpha chain
MTDINQVEADLMARVAGAADEAAIEAVRVAALGKSGVISGLLASLGKMQPDERKTAGQAFNALRDRVQTALGEKKEMLGAAALDARLASETVDVTLPVRDSALEMGRIHR